MESANAETAEQSSIVVAEDDPLAIFRAPLLREGTMLVDVKSKIVRDRSRGRWLLQVDPTRSDAPASQFILLPCTQLSEMQLLMESASAAENAASTQRVHFLVTGRIFVYRSENYLLPTHAPVVIEESPQRDDPAAKPPLATPDATDGGGYRLGAGETAEQLMQNLEQSAGSMARHSATVGEPPAAVSGVDSAATKPGAVLREDTPVVTRRGKISRDAAGAWTFVFDADAKGLTDPPVRLLPCLLLERIEEYARRVGNNSPAIVSGQVLLYNGQNYLLPTVFRIPTERRNLIP